MESLRRLIVTLSDSFNLCQAVKSDKGTGLDKRLRIVTAMLRQVYCVSTLSDTCICRDSHDARRRFDEGSGPFPFVAFGNERTSPRVRYLRIQHRCEDNIADAFGAYASSQNGDWLSAESISRTFLDTSEFEALFCVSDFVATLNFWKHVS